MVAMALNIKDAETDRLARELAAVTGESITQAARIALEERLRRVRARQESDVTRQAVREIIERARTRKVVDSRNEDEILGYDENGIPA